MALILLAAAIGIGPWLPIRWFVAAYAVAAAAWLLVRRASLRLPAVLVIAVLLRVVLLVPAPRLSGDVYRYLWDGKVLRSGTNPYALAPDDPRLVSLREPWHGRINHPEIRTIYPPHAQLLFALVPSLTGWRLLILACDLAAVVLLRRHGLAYATFPPLLVEGVWNSHVDAIAAALVAVAVVRGSGAALGMATGLKVIPMAALPALFTPRRLVTFSLALVLPALAFLRGPIMPGFREYATRWIFNSPAYDVVFWIAERVPTKAIWTEHPLRFAWLSDVVYRHVYPDFITRAVLGILALGAIVLARRKVATALSAFLLLTPTIHPWYWLVIAPAALVERSTWIAFALCAPFSYLLYEDVPKLAVYALCYGLPMAAMWRRPV